MGESFSLVLTRSHSPLSLCSCSRSPLSLCSCSHSHSALALTLHSHSVLALTLALTLTLLSLSLCLLGALKRFPAVVGSPCLPTLWRAGSSCFALSLRRLSVGTAILRQATACNRWRTLWPTFSPFTVPLTPGYLHSIYEEELLKNSTSRLRLLILATAICRRT